MCFALPSKGPFAVNPIVLDVSPPKPEESPATQSGGRTVRGARPLELITRFERVTSLIGLYNLDDVYELQNIRGETLPIPDTGKAYINPGLSEIYGVNIGDTLIAALAGTEYAFTVTDIAANAKSASIY